MTTPIVDTPSEPQARVDRYRQAAALLRKWMGEDDGYDERVWPLLDADLKEGAFHCREIGALAGYRREEGQP